MISFKIYNSELYAFNFTASLLPSSLVLKLHACLYKIKPFSENYLPEKFQGEGSEE